jgi:structural maintenance of chromosome 4
MQRKISSIRPLSTDKALLYLHENLEPSMQLRLESITIHNFKSYKGTHTIAQLDPEFTAVIGPNGSGKSNVIDSILFVLGFRAKKMRHASLTDLIYSDGRREDMCYVELHFNKFKVRREVYLNKRARYMVDGDEVGTAELAALLASEGVDLERNRFLILQGEIESIAMMKPKDGGLLEFLEDIIGTTRYKPLLEQNEAMLRQYDEENESRSVTLKFYEKEYQHIEQKRNESLELLEKNTAILQRKRTCETLSMKIHAMILNGAKAEREEIERELGEFAKKNSEHMKKMRKLEEECKERKNVLRRRENELLETKREYQRAERENAMEEEKKKKLERQVKVLSAQIEDGRSRMEMERTQSAAFRKELEENANEIKKYMKEAEKKGRELRAEMDKVNRNAKKHVESIRKNEEQILELLQKRSVLAQTMGMREAEINVLVSKRDEVADEMGDVRDKLGELKQIEGRPDCSAEKLRDEVQAIESDLQATQKEILKRRQRAEEHKESEERSHRDSELLRHIRDKKGVYGRLRDLGSIEARYAVALDAAGKMLNSIVVDTTRTAEECIATIKRQGLGRVTFVILDKVGGIPGMPQEQVPYLFTLVGCDEQFRKCFYFALKDTLVCSELEDAKRTAFGRTRKRVVTLDGKLIEKSGVMAGGRISHKIKQVDDLERACARMVELRERKLAELRAVERLESKGGLEMRLKELNGTFERTQREIDEKNSALDRGEVGRVEERIARFKDAVAESRAAIEGFVTAESRARKDELSLLNGKIEMLEKRNQELELQLGAVSNVNLVEKTSELEKRMRELSHVFTKDISALRRSVEETEATYKECLSDYLAAQEQYMQIKNEMGNDYHLEISLRNKTDDLEDKGTESRKQMEQSAASIERLEKELEKHLALCGRKKEVVGRDVDEMDERGLRTLYSSELEKLKKAERENAGREINFAVFNEFESAKGEYVKAKGEYDWFKGRYDQVRNENEECRKRRLEEFMEGFNAISKNLKEIYRTITYGGNAELELVDYLDPFSEGVVLSVMPPKKSWKCVSNLSGGEKTLSSLALIFALHKYKPSPFYVMDEIDAALDYRNVSVISNYIREMSSSAQFIVVSLRNDMFELSRTLLGVYKTRNISRFLVVNIDSLRI